MSFKNINNKILNTSIEYDSIFLNNSSENFESIIDKISNEKNFYGILASLEKIKLQLSNKKFKEANDAYKKLLQNKNITNIYKSAIAIHASYSLLKQIDIIKDFSLKRDDIKTISENIESYLLFVDQNLESYQGFKLEILFLLSIIEQDLNKQLLISETTNNLYKKIQENEKIQLSIKERVNKIYEFQKYK